MLLECKHCGAPLDVGGGEMLTRCKYCGTVSRAKALKTVATVTPPEWRPPAQWTPPASARADSSRALVYHATWAIGRLVRTLVTIGVLLILAPIFLAFVIHWVKSSIGEREVGGALEAAASAMKLAEEQMRAAAQQNPQPRQDVDLLSSAGAAELLAEIRKRFGNDRVRMLELAIYRSQAVLKIQDPKDARHVDQFTYRDGRFDEPMPVNVQHLRKKLEQQLFDLDEAGLDGFSALVEIALDRLKLEDGKPTHVLIDKATGRKPTVRIYAAGPRENGHVELDPDGKVRRVFK